MGIQERRQREFARREREILDAALTLFDSDDWLSVTVEQIANAADTIMSFRIFRASFPLQTPYSTPTSALRHINHLP